MRFTLSHELWGPRITRAILLGGIVVWCANALIRWWLDVPLGHDEARYALDARAPLDADPMRFVYSGGGMNLVALPGLLAGGSERALRFVPMLLGAGLLATAWLAARTACGARTAAWTVAVLAGARQFVKYSAELLSDLPSTALLLVAITVLIRELFLEEVPRPRVLAVAPLCGAAFYLRYGSVVPIVMIAAAFGVLAVRPIRRRPWLIAATAAAFILLLVPHAVRAIALTGSPVGILRLSSEIPGPGSGLDAYVRDPLASYGVLVAPLMLIGLAVARPGRIAVTLQLIAFAHIVALTVLTQAQPRYVFLATILLVILGVDVLRCLVSAADGHTRLVLTACALLAVVALWASSLLSASRYAEMRVAGPSRVLVAAAIVRADHGGQACEVVGDDATRLEWYSGCRGARILDPQRVARGYEVRDGALRPLPPNATRVAFLPGFLEVIRMQR